MIPMTAIREEFGTAKRLTRSTFHSALQLGKGTTHYYFRSVRGVLPDLVATCVDTEDSGFAVEFLEAVALRIGSDIERPHKFDLTVANAYGFNAAIVLPSPYHGHLKGVLDDKHATLALGVPIHNCEFTGNETPQEYRQWHTRVGVERWKRQPFPFAAMEFRNPSDNYGSPMERLSFEACMANLESLAGETKGFAKVANFAGNVVQITPIRGLRYCVEAETRKLVCNSDELMALMSGFVSTGKLPES